MKLVTALVLATGALAVPAIALVTPAAAVAAPAVAVMASAPTAAATGLAGSLPRTQTTPPGATTAALQPLDVASDRTALNAYVSYLAAIVRDIPAAQANQATYVSTIANQCPSALQPLTQGDQAVSTTAKQTLTALGEEMGDDLSINFDQAARPAFDRMLTSLSRLRWTRLSGGAAIVRRYLNTETTVLEMAPSDLCKDAVLAASAEETVPPGTHSFIKSYKRTSNSANNALDNLLALMQSYTIASERNTVARIANLATQITRLTRSSMQQAGTSLQATLGAT